MSVLYLLVEFLKNHYLNLKGNTQILCYIVLFCLKKKKKSKNTPVLKTYFEILVYIEVDDSRGERNDGYCKVVYFFLALEY